MTSQPPINLDLDPAALGLVTDLYQLTMMAGYAAEGLGEQRAVFELFVRRLPARRAYLVFAGLEQAVGAVRSLRFSPEQVAAIRDWPAFEGVEPGWFDMLLDFRFEGDLWAVPEGTVVFAGEPLLRVEAKLPQAQLVETLLLGMLGYPTLVASKAARIVEAARGRGVIDFGARRGHGIQASFHCARSAYLAGFEGTSQVEAARRLGIPAMGTMAHSWVQAFDDERAAFEAFSRRFPRSTLLVDTYDTAEGVLHAAAIEPPIRAIRIDSGDLAAEATRARAILDEHGRREVEIILSGDLDEDSIAGLIEAGAPADRFGVGTELITSGGAPALSMVYKLVESGGIGRIKKSSGKRTYPLAKQVDRFYAADGTIDHDHVVRADEPIRGEALLRPVLHRGRLVGPLPTLGAIREHCERQRRLLPESIRGLDPPGAVTIRYSQSLQDEATRLGLEHSTSPAPGPH